MFSRQEIENKLDPIWRQLKNAGTNENISIVESIAALLTKELPFPDTSLKPKTLNTATPIDFETIRSTLETLALQTEGGIPALFDSYILFQLKEDAGKGQFPIPRSILRFILALARIKPDHDIADFTCGSAGFFVHLNRIQTQIGTMVAIEKDPRWARIAQANLLLHNLPIKVELGDALKIAGLQEPLAQKQFDRILMAPSFGEHTDSEAIRRIFQRDLSTRSDIVMPSFALNKLNDHGRAVIIVPANLLTRPDEDTLQLRKELVSAYHLEAVISLPLDALQPFSTLPTSLLVVQKNQPTETTATWFLESTATNYSQGKSENITQPTDADKSGVMQFITKIITADSLPSENIITDTATPRLQITRLFQDSVPLGVIINSPENFPIESINFHCVERKNQEDYRFLLVNSSRDTTETQIYHIHIDLSSDSNQPLKTALIPDTEQWLREIYKLEDEAATLPPGDNIAISLHSTNTFVIDTHGRLVGTLIPQSSILNSPQIELNPEKYLHLEDDTTIDHPAKLLGKVRTNQRKLYKRIDNFMGRLDIPTMLGQPIPPKLYTGPLSTQTTKTTSRPLPRLLEFSDKNPFFNTDQQNVWNKVRQQVITINDYSTARHFTVEDVEIGGKATTLATLNLLIRMGLVVSVTILEQDKPVARYRRITERDIWQRKGEEN